jgi:outer membrane autotransporter protein
LSGNTANLQGNIANNGAVVFNQPASGSYAGNMSGSGSLTKTGAGTLTLSGTASYTGGTTVSAGVLQGNTSNLQGNIVNNGSVVFNQSTNGTYAGNMSGNGSLTKDGAGTVSLTGTNTYSGGTSIVGGNLSVNGNLTSNVAVGGAGSLKGSGTIIGDVVNSGVLAPGNSIGTLNVAGNYIQNASSNYQVEVNAAGQNDRLNVSGIAYLAGSVSVLAAAGSYGRSTTYTILNAAGGLSGAYSGVTSNYAFLRPSLNYDDNNVYLTLLLWQSAFAAGAQTANQRAVGTVLDAAFDSATGDFGNALYAMTGLNAAQGPAALNAISGQNYSGFGSGMVQSAQLFMDTFAAYAGGGANARATLAQACDVACDTTAGWGVWGGALGGTGTILGDGNTSTFTYSSGGFAAGIDRQITPEFLLGVTVGYLTGTQWTDGFTGRGSSDSFLTGLYGSYRAGGLYVDGLAGFAYNENQLRRGIVIPDLAIRNAYGRTGANQLFGQVEIGYRFDLGGAAQAFVTPFARLQGSTATQSGFTETGANSLNLNIAQQSTNSVRSVIGAQLGGSMDMGWRERLAVQLRLGWSHEHADTSRPVNATLAGAPSLPFTVYGASPQRDGVLLGLGANTSVADNTSIYLRYEGNVSAQGNSQALSAGVRLAW